MAKKFNFTKGLTKTGLQIGGGIAANVVSKKVMPDMNAKIKNGALLGLSILAPSFIKNEMVSDLASGMAVVSGVNLLSSFVPGLSGIDDDVVMGYVGYNSDNDYMPEGNEPLDISGTEDDASL